MRPYEAVVVVDPALEGQEGGLEALLGRLERVIAESGGAVHAVERWGRRRLAHPVKRQTEGYYVFLEFDAAARTPQELERVLRITDGVLRHLVVRQVARRRAAEQSQTAAAVGEEASQAT